MVSLIRRFSLVLALALPLPSFAYTVGVLGASGINYYKKTYVVVSGFGKEMHGAFFFAAATKALKLKQMFPLDQVILVRALDNAHYDWGKREDYPEYSDEKGLEMDADEMRKAGFNVVINDDEDLDGDDLVEYLSSFTRMAGIDVYSHFSPFMGARTSTGSGRAGLRFANDDLEEMEDLKGRFAPGAYIAFHGCNSGWINAPMVSEYLGVAVMGSLTGTDLQHLAEDGEWYFNDGDRWPKPLKRAKEMKNADGTTLRCPPNGCARFRPINTVYHGGGETGASGKIEAGQPFYKFFCAYGWDRNGDAECHKTMANFILGWPSPTVKPVSLQSPIEDIKVAVLDYLCPTSKAKAPDSARQKCVNAILEAEATGREVYSPFSGNPVACDMKQCFAELDKNTSLFWDTGGDVRAPKNPNDRTIVQEYKRIMKGFELLKASPFSY